MALTTVNNSKPGQIAKQLRYTIKKDNLKAGTRIPGVRELAEEFKVSTKTVKLALDILQNEKVLRCEHGRGIFVEQQSFSGEIDVYTLLWGMRREPSNYFEEIMRIAYPPILRQNFLFTTRTVFKDSDDFSHFEHELAIIENSPQIKCVLAPSAHFNVEHFEKLSQLHCPVVYFGDSKYEEAFDFPRNRVVDTSDWTSEAVSSLFNKGYKELTVFIPDGSIMFYRECTRRLIRLASERGMKINLIEFPCSLFNERDTDKIRALYARNIIKAKKNSELDCPIIVFGMINQIFMELPEIKERIAHETCFLEPQLSGVFMNDFYDAVFDVIEDAIHDPQNIHVKTVNNPIMLHDYSRHKD